jgi:hypothetical protein
MPCSSSGGETARGASTAHVDRSPPAFAQSTSPSLGLDKGHQKLRGQGNNLLEGSHADRSTASATARVHAACTAYATQPGSTTGRQLQHSHCWHKRLPSQPAQSGQQERLKACSRIWLGQPKQLPAPGTHSSPGTHAPGRLTAEGAALTPHQTDPLGADVSLRCCPCGTERDKSSVHDSVRLTWVTCNASNGFFGMVVLRRSAEGHWAG